MARKIQPLGELADSVLSHVEQEQVEKTAQAAYTSSRLHTELGQGLAKVAGQLRSLQADRVTNDDLAEFRKRYHV
jgi:hypothetical protein